MPTDNQDDKQNEPQPEQPESLADSIKKYNTDPNSSDWLQTLDSDVATYIKSLRQEAASRRIEARELSKNVDSLKEQLTAKGNAELESSGQLKDLVQQLQHQNDELKNRLNVQQLRNDRIAIGLEHGLDAQWIDRLQGTSPDELAADAKRLADLLKSIQVPQQMSAIKPQDKPPEQLVSDEKPPANPPVVPAGDKEPNRDELRKQIYFSGGNRSPLFDATAGGVINFGSEASDSKT